MVDGNPVAQPENPYYRSSTPLIAVIKYLSDLQNSAPLVMPETVRDPGFTVNSDPAFLYLIAKMCLQAGIYVDLACQCLHQYLALVSYNKSSYPCPGQLIQRGLVMLGLVLLKLNKN